MKFLKLHSFRVLFISVCLILASGCTSLPTEINKTESFSFQDTETTHLGKVSTALINKQVPTSSEAGVLPLASGIDAFTARYILAKHAERSIDVQYYIWHNDTTGKLLMHALLSAANRGVRVRLLLDDIHTTEIDAPLLALDNHKNIEVRLFNPFPNRGFRLFDFITDFFRVNRRMHNKSFTIDNQVTIVGGRNIGDEYFEANPSLDFHDFDIMAIGKVVNDVSQQFDEYWNHDKAIPINVLNIHQEKITPQALKRNLEDFFIKSYKTPYISAVKKSDFINKLQNKKLSLHWSKAKVIYDPPNKVQPEDHDTTKFLLPKLTPYIDATNKELILVSPYFIPGWRGMNRIKALRKRDVSVKVLTNSLASTDVPIVYSAYAPYRVQLLENKVDLYEIKITAQVNYGDAKDKKQSKKKRSITSSSRASLHSKIYVLDRKNVFIGSFNLDPRSSKLNTEMGIMLFDSDLAGKIGDWWDNQINKVAYKLGVTSAEDEYEEEYYIHWDDLTTNPSTRYHEPPKTNLLQMFSSDIFSFLPIEDHL